MPHNIHIHVINAMDLPNMDWMGKTDAYCKVSMGGQEVMKTKVINNNLNPVWDAKSVVKWDGINDLIFSIWDSDTLTKDDWVGQYVLPKSQIRAGFKGSVPLQIGTSFQKGASGKRPVLTLKVEPPESGCCGGCSVM
mmetsp:Transcript_29402/g.91457  ORF Transcript_29402/g.91457 Transcript_29402/m.91457 type:complete len:137 (-) Transcript_29402:4-414(-)